MVYKKNEEMDYSALLGGDISDNVVVKDDNGISTANYPSSDIETGVKIASAVPSDFISNVLDLAPSTKGGSLAYKLALKTAAIPSSLAVDFFSCAITWKDEQNNKDYEEYNVNIEDSRIDEIVTALDFIAEKGLQLGAGALAKKGLVMAFAIGGFPLVISLTAAGVATAIIYEEFASDIVKDSVREFLLKNKIKISEVATIPSDVPENLVDQYIEEKRYKTVSIEDKTLTINLDYVVHQSGDFKNNSLDLYSNAIKEVNWELLAQKYQIVKGDTLFEIARDHGVTVEDLMAVNPQIKDADLIYAGENLLIPPAIDSVEVRDQLGDVIFEMHRDTDLQQTFGDSISYSEEDVFVKENIDGTKETFIKSDAKAIMQDGSEENLGELLDSVNSKSKVFQDYIQTSSMRKLENLFKMNAGENQINSGFENLTTDLIKGLNNGKSWEELSQEILQKNMKKDVAEDLLTKADDSIKKEIAQKIGIDIDNIDSQVQSYIDSNALAQQVNVVKAQLQSKVDDNFSTINNLAKNKLGLNKDLNELSEDDVELIAKNYVINNFSKSLLEEANNGSLDSIKDLSDSKIADLASKHHNQDLNKVANNAVLDYANSQIKSQNLVVEKYNDFQGSLRESGILKGDLANTILEVESLYREKDLTKLANNLIVESVGQDLVDKISNDATGMINSYIEEKIGINIQNSVAKVEQYLASSEAKIMQGGITGMGVSIVSGIISGNSSVEDAVFNIAKEKLRDSAIATIETGVTKIATSFGASSKLAGNVAGATVEVFNLLADGEIGAEEVLKAAVSHVVSTVATALVQTLVPFMPPFLSSMIGGVIGGYISSLFGGAPLPPPPPLTITEAKEDGSGNITFITGESSGYGLKATKGNDDDLIGNRGNDNLIGNNGNDKLYGKGGNDTLIGNAGLDILMGNEGDDYIRGGNGDDTILGGEGSDEIYGDELDNYGNGDDTINGNEGDDQIFGGQGNDTIGGDSGRDYISGGSGNDTIEGGDGNDIIYGDEGEDDINGGLGNDKILGGADNDTIYGGLGDDSISGGDGDDFISGDSGKDTIWGNKGVDYLFGDLGDDILIGGEDDDTLIGGFGDDELLGGTGNNTLTGNEGKDRFVITQNTIASTDIITDFQQGEDRVQIISDDVFVSSKLSFYSDEENNRTNIYFENGQTITLEDITDLNINDFLNGLGYDGNNNNISIDNVLGEDAVFFNRFELASTKVSQDVIEENFLTSDNIFTQEDVDSILFNNEYWKKTGGKKPKNKLHRDTNFNGSSKDDQMYGSWWSEVIRSGDGHDEILGGDGHDTIYSGTGNDWIDGGSGNDTVYGGDGHDKIYGGKGTDTLYGEDGNDSLFGHDGHDKIYGGQGQDYVVGGAGDDLIVVEGYNNQVDGGSGGDTIILETQATYGSSQINSNVVDAGKGDDYIKGGDSSDTIYASAGDDTILDSRGSDKIYLGKGRDMFFANISLSGSSREIVDFNTAEDKVIISDNLSFNAIKNYLSYSGSDTIFSYNGYELILRNTNIVTLNENNFAYKEFVGTEGGNGIYANNSDNELYGLNGNDKLVAYDGDDIIYGQDGHDEIHGGDGNDIINGGSGTDKLYGGWGDDILISGSGDDSTVYGYRGNDTYVYNKGDGHDRFYDDSYADANDKILFGEDIRQDHIALRRVGNELRIYFKNRPDDSITIVDQFYYDGDSRSSVQHHRIETLEFSDGSVIDLSTRSDPTFTYTDSSEEARGSNHTDDIIYAGDGNDVLRAYDGDDILYGESGHDDLHGYNGNDKLYGGLGDDDFWGGDGNDLLEGGDGVDRLWGGWGDDILAAGKGNEDTIYGYRGDDTYVFNKGDGHDVFYDDSYADANDKIKFGSGISKSDVILTREPGNDLLIRFKYGSFDSVRIRDQFHYDGYNSVSSQHHLIESLEFEDGVIDLSSGSDVRFDYGLFLVTDIHGSNHTDDIIYAGAGNDVVRGYKGDDELYGEADNDDLHGYDGDDKLYGGSGVDKLYGGYGNDSLYGNSGNDVLEGGRGNDIYVFNKGDGQDTIFDARGDASGHQDVADKLVINGYSIEQINFSRVGADFVITFVGTNDKINIGGHFHHHFNHRIEKLEIVNSGVTLDLSKDVILHGDSSSQRIDGTHYSNDTIYGRLGNDDLYGHGGDDTLYGNSGNDVLRGGRGNDTYVFNKGDGVDVIIDAEGDPYGHQDALDKLVINGYRFEDLIFKRLGYNFEISFVGTNDKIDIRSHFHYHFNHRIERLEIVDSGITLDLSNAAFLSGTLSADLIDGSNNKDDIIHTESGDDILKGYGGNDSLFGGSGIDRLFGGIGDDNLYGGDGKDYLYGNEGNDKIYGQNGDDFLYSGSGADYLDGGSGEDMAVYWHSNSAVSVNLKKNSGYTGDAAGDKLYNIENIDGSQYYNDTLEGNDNSNKIYGNGGDDWIDGFGGNDILHGGSGVDQILGRTGNDTIYGGDDRDFLYGHEGDDKIYGQNGDDVLYSGLGSDYLDGGSGRDMAVYWHSNSAVSVNLKKNSGYSGDAAGDRLYNIEDISGSQYYNDTLEGSDIANNIYGNGGDDWIDGFGGDDNLHGGSGVDQILGRTGNDTIYGGDDRDFLYGHEGDDKIYGQNGDDLLYSGLGADYLDGGSGRDMAVYWHSNSAVSVNLKKNSGYTGDADGDKLYNIEDIGGSQYYNDTLEGSDIANNIYGHGGDDWIDGFGGDDNLHGGSGVDKILGRTGNDTIYGGDDRDFLYGHEGDDKIYGQNGDDFLYSGLGSDYLDGGSGIDMAVYWHSSSGVSVNLREHRGYSGDAAGDRLYNIENLDGSQYYSDFLTGNDANNDIYGHGGNDVLNGGGGSDNLWGGSGSDTFTYTQLSDSINTNLDIIKDFAKGQDKIDLSALDFDSISHGKGSANSNDELEYYIQSGNTIIDDPESDFAIKLQGEINLSDSDFIF